MSKRSAQLPILSHEWRAAVCAETGACGREHVDADTRKRMVSICTQAPCMAEKEAEKLRQHIADNAADAGPEVMPRGGL
jgi:hypothetical protein